MRRTRTFAWIAAALIIAGCGMPELRQFGQEPAPTPSWATTFDDVVTAKLPTIAPLAQAKKQAVKGDIDVEKAVGKLDKAWHVYLGGLNDGRLGTHPTAIRSVELDPDESFGTVCDMGPNHRFPAETVQPTYCPDFDLGSPTPALMVLPAGFTGKVEAFAGTNGELPAWVLTSVAAGLTYAVHLRHEMKISGVMWPDGVPFDYCTVGIGLRAIFPKDIKVLEGADVTAIMTMVDQLVTAPDEPGLRLGNLVKGFKTGRLEACIA